MTLDALHALQPEPSSSPVRVLTPTVPPPDEADRRRVAGAYDETVFTVAGAGSGKTRHLVERVVGLLLSGRARIDQLAVITFTEAAAAELRDRVAEALEEAVAQEGAAGPEGLAGPEEALAALVGLDGAAITTLHGFARRILAEHAFEAGVPPAFEVLDEANARAELDGRWVALLDRLLGDERCARALQRVLVAGADLAAFRPIARRMAEHWDRIEGANPPPCGRARSELPPIGAFGVLEPLRRALGLAGACNEEDTLLAHLTDLAPFAARLEEVSAHGPDGPGQPDGLLWQRELETLRLLVGPPGRLSAGRRGRKLAWGGRKDEVVAFLEQAESARQGVLQAVVGSALRELAASLGAQVVREARRRQAEGRLQYHDLLVLACEVVRDRPEVRGALHERYRYLLVDEFQDTDPLQARLLAMIAAEPGAPVDRTEWWRLPTVPGALFFVGDPLQSIYGFRRADVATFLRTWRALEPASASLMANFRSEPGIVHLVNAVFGTLVGEGLGDVQPPFRSAVPARAAPRPATDGPVSARADGRTPACPVTVLGLQSERPARAGDARRAEAAELAGLLRRALDEGWHVGEDGRRLQTADVAILVPARSSVPSLEEALNAAGLEYRLESSSLLYGAPEVQDLLAVLRAVDDPSDAAAVVAALRTPGFGCGDDDLLRFRRSGGNWDYRLAPPAGAGPGDPVGEAFAELTALHEAKSWAGVSELVARVVSERCQLEAALDGPRWREEWRRLRYVQDQARQFSERSPGGLRQYLAWVDVQQEEDSRVTEVVLPEVDAPSIAIMTVHAAKGLEFPVVAVVGLGGVRQAVRGPTVLFGERGPELAIDGHLCTDGFEALRAREELVAHHEQLRLLYVAATRAREHLVLSVHRSARADRSVAALVEAALGDAVGLWATPETARPGAAVNGRRAASALGLFDDPLATALAPAPGSAGALGEWARARKERLGRRPPVVSATGIAKLVAPHAGRPVPGAECLATGLELAETDGGGAGPDGIGTPWRRGRGGTAVGRAVHAVLQTVDLRSGEGLDEMARTQAAAEGVPGRAQEIAALARAALGSDPVRTAAESPHWRELYVGVPVGTRVLEGFVDLLFEGPSGLEVIDYKTDAVAGDEDLDRLTRRYRLQGAAYARAVQAVVGRPVVACTLLFLRSGRAEARRVEDLATAMAEVEAALGEPA